ncbi:hypothetical protein [Limnohabitans sp. Hippo3]|uniref:hypothetical protein n=1 Tax=Limnohabitans sp. Hippo3 TaxID=1597956 RepID=UPI001304D562|nr:hypothetical protein [Limnohabitans sp. Hippo3]
MTSDITCPNSEVSWREPGSLLSPKSMGALLLARLAVSIKAMVMGVSSGQGFHGFKRFRGSGHFLPLASVIT